MGRGSKDASALCLLACSSTAVGALHLTSSVPSGSLIRLSVEFYGQRFDNTVNLELLARFFDNYPDFVDRAFLSIKGQILPCPTGGTLERREPARECQCYPQSAARNEEARLERRDGAPC